MLQTLHNFFVLKNSPHDAQTIKKIILLNAILVISTLVMILFGLRHILTYQQPINGIFILIGAILSTLTIIDFQKNKSIERTSIIVTIVLFIGFILTTIIQSNQHFSLIWTIFFPLLAFELNGYKKGFVFSGIFYLIVFTLAYHGIGTWLDGDWTFESYLRFVIASLILINITFINRISESNTSKILKVKDQKEQEYIKKLEDLSSLDSLTKLYNRRKIDEILDNELSRSERHNRPLVVSIFDIDDFKNVNDIYGHIVGDKVLIELAQLIKASTRKSDYFGRWGGEEFILIFPETTIDQATALVEKLRNIISSHPFLDAKNITCSFGITQMEKYDTITTIINKADKGLYEAKNSGKNCVKVFYKTS